MFEEKYEPKLEFPEGWGFKPKNPPWGSIDVFWKYTITAKAISAVLAFQH